MPVHCANYRKGRADAEESTEYLDTSASALFPTAEEGDRISFHALERLGGDPDYTISSSNLTKQFQAGVYDVDWLAEMVVTEPFGQGAVHLVAVLRKVSCD